MVDRLLAWIRSLPQRFINWWERFTVRQKITIAGITVAIMAAIIVLVSILSKPQMLTITVADTPAQAQEIVDLLNSEGIPYETDIEGLEIRIRQKDYTRANLLLGSNNIYTTGFGIDNVTTGGFTTTESDKQKRYVVYLTEMMEEALVLYDFVREANVQLTIPDNNGTLLAQQEEASASVLLTLSGECTTDMAAGIARFVATGLGNKSTENIVILDSTGKLLFSGSDEASSIGSASSAYALQDQITNSVKNQVKQILLATNLFSNIEVGANIVLNTSNTEISEHVYWPDGDNSQGVLASYDVYESDSSGGISGVPGTDSNTGPSYEYENSEYSNASVREESYQYLPNERITMSQIPAGTIKYEDSSITVTLLTYNIAKEEDIRRQGLLDGTTWEDYKLANDIRNKVEVDADLYQAVSTATGISTSNITIIAYEEPFFIDKEGVDIEATDVIQIVLILLILGLLAFVIYRSMKASKEEEEEPEINIDEILRSNPTEDLEEIGVEDKSEARKIVERFVEDNPEAAANLLRNWLNEDWD